MQVNNSEQCLYIGKRNIKKTDDDGNVNNYYFINVADETGEVIPFFSNKDVFNKCDIFGLATPVMISIEISPRQRGVSASLVDITPA